MRVHPWYPQLHAASPTAGPSQALPADKGGKLRRAHFLKGPATRHHKPPAQASSALAEEGRPGEDSFLAITLTVTSDASDVSWG
ncbi:hypothetical protein E2C01_065587 [Portunus trituberculatus]|uniref:Uncharacterized protein n=1 Tax=Portunus trituberculatus TaxID=210409 RepID=A0A5B7HM99_PORTR|nr:hypothetical protein [Portunus trituberculatus]